MPNISVKLAITSVSILSSFAAAFAFPQHSIPDASQRSLPLVDDETYPTILPPSPKGIIFDMDGTLIQHSIDFADMRRRINSVVDADPVTVECDDMFVMAAQLSAAGQEQCQLIWKDIEKKAIQDMRTMCGGAELLQYLQENDLKCAVLTRNRERNVQVMTELYLSEMNKGSTEQLFHTIVARDTMHPTHNRALKVKPNPEGILHISKVWDHDPSEIIMVGDNANDDIMAANEAKCGGSVLLMPDGKVFDTHSGYKVGDSEEEVMLRTPSLSVKSLLEFKSYLVELLNERSDRRLAIDKNMGKPYKPQPMKYSADTYSGVVPHIGVKNV